MQGRRRRTDDTDLDVVAVPRRFLQRLAPRGGRSRDISVSHLVRWVLACGIMTFLPTSGRNSGFWKSLSSLLDGMEVTYVGRLATCRSISCGLVPQGYPSDLFGRDQLLIRVLRLKLPSFIHEVSARGPLRLGARVFHCVPRRALHYTCSGVAGLARTS